MGLRETRIVGWGFGILSQDVAGRAQPIDSFFKPDEANAIKRDNALKLVPRLKSA